MPIEEKPYLRDLGVEMSNDCTFSAHIENTVAAGNILAGWALRSFRGDQSMTCSPSEKPWCSPSWTTALYFAGMAQFIERYSGLFSRDNL